MRKSKESWEPFPEEIKRAEDMMTDEQRQASEGRQKAYPFLALHQSLHQSLKDVDREMNTPLAALGVSSPILKKLENANIKDIGMLQVRAKHYSRDEFPLNEDEIEILNQVLVEKGFGLLPPFKDARQE